MKVYRVDTDEQVHQQIDALPAEAPVAVKSNETVDLTGLAVAGWVG